MVCIYGGECDGCLRCLPPYEEPEPDEQGRDEDEREAIFRESSAD